MRKLLLLLLFAVSFTACTTDMLDQEVALTTTDMELVDEFDGLEVVNSAKSSTVNKVRALGAGTSYGEFTYYLTKANGKYKVDFFRSNKKRSKVLTIATDKKTGEIVSGSLDLKATSTIPKLRKVGKGEDIKSVNHFMTILQLELAKAEIKAGTDNLLTGLTIISLEKSLAEWTKRSDGSTSKGTLLEGLDFFDNYLADRGFENVIYNDKVVLVPNNDSKTWCGASLVENLDQIELDVWLEVTDGFYDANAEGEIGILYNMWSIDPIVTADLIDTLANHGCEVVVEEEEEEEDMQMSAYTPQMITLELFITHAWRGSLNPDGVYQFVNAKGAVFTSLSAAETFASSTRRWSYVDSDFGDTRSFSISLRFDPGNPVATLEAYENIGIDILGNSTPQAVVDAINAINKK